MVTDDETPASPRRLYFYVPSLTGRFHDWDEVVRRLRMEPGHEHDVVEHARAFPGLCTRGKLEDFANKVVEQLDELDTTGRYDEITLVGNSIGSLITRWAWLSAAGEINGPTRRVWIDKVKRIVLIAGLSRGVFTRLKKTSYNQQRPSLRIVLIKVGSMCPGRFAWKDALAGAPFVTEVRLRWMRLGWREGGTQHASPPEVVQILGTKDDLVKRDDSLDTEVFPSGHHVCVPNATHSDVLNLRGKDAELRYERIRTALIDPMPDDDTAPPGLEQRDFDNVAFVVHGIRVHSAKWIEALRDKLDDDFGWAAVAPPYGFFSALAFALPFSRHRKVRWFLDQYSDEVARNRKARFHFAGHSNGTFLLGHALETVKAVKFDRVYLASSVLPADYPWDKLHDAGRIGRVRSDCGSKDVPVGLLARGLSGFPKNSDIGGGGFVGFDDLTGNFAVQMRWIHGGHGAPLETDELRGSVADFVRGIEAKDPPLDSKPTGWLRAVSRHARGVVWAALIVVVVAVLTAWLIFGWLGGVIALGVVSMLVVLAGVL